MRLNGKNPGSTTDKKGIFICFIGIDGSGKSTLAKTLIERMKHQDIKMEYTWCKFESSLFKMLIFAKNKLIVRESNWKKNYKKSKEIKSNLFKGHFISFIYEWFVLIDYRVRILRKISVPLIFGKNLICDRYIFDTVVDIAVDLNYSDGKLISRINQLLDFSPKPNLVFWVDLPEEVALSRKKDVPSIGFLNEKRNLYKKIGAEFEFIELDGTKSLQELNDKIEKEIVKALDINSGLQYE